MKLVKVTYTGYGLGYNSYPGELEFYVHDDFSEDEIFDRIQREVKKKSCCNSISINSTSVKAENE